MQARVHSCEHACVCVYEWCKRGSGAAAAVDKHASTHLYYCMAALDYLRSRAHVHQCSYTLISVHAFKHAELLQSAQEPMVHAAEPALEGAASRHEASPKGFVGGLSPDARTRDHAAFVSSAAASCGFLRRFQRLPHHCAKVCAGLVACLSHSGERVS